MLKWHDTSSSNIETAVQAIPNGKIVYDTRGKGVSSELAVLPTPQEVTQRKAPTVRTWEQRITHTKGYRKYTTTKDAANGSHTAPTLRQQHLPRITNPL